MSLSEFKKRKRRDSDQNSLPTQIQVSESSSSTIPNNTVIQDVNQSRMVFECENVSPDFWDTNVHNVCCWLDCEPFDGPIYSYPIRKEHDKWTVRGIFCSLHCVKRFIIDLNFQNNSLLTDFSLMCLQIYGIEDEIVPAPQYQMLQKFSIPGNKSLTLKEFRAAGPQNRAIRIVYPPIYPFQFPKAFICEQNTKDEINNKRQKGYYVMHHSGISEHKNSNSNLENEKSKQNQPNIQKEISDQLENETNVIPKFPSRRLTNLNSFFPTQELSKDEKNLLASSSEHNGDEDEGETDEEGDFELGSDGEDEGDGEDDDE